MVNHREWEAANISIEPPHSISTEITHFLTDLTRLE